MAFKDLNPEQRLIAVHTDMLQHPEFCVLGAVSQVGNVIMRPGMVTAGTDGADVYYDPAFVTGMTRKQLRYLCAHEQAHRMLRHCVEYRSLKKDDPQTYGMAIDYVVNAAIESMDKDKTFLERPTSTPPLIRDDWLDKSVPEVFRLLKKEQEKDGKGKGKGGGQGQVIDVHMDPKEGDGDGEPMTPEQQQAVQQAVEEAIIQGRLVQRQLRQMAGTGAGTSALDGHIERHTDWRGPLRRFLTEISEGDENSRFSPPNKRLLASGYIMPSHFQEGLDSLFIACDTSGSMGGIYPLVFGELCNIVQTTQPKRVHVLWWDTEVSEQIFEPRDYARLRDVIKPVGGGGTTVSCVAQYMRAKGYKPKATVMISDGYLESVYETPPGNLLWGIVSNPGFQPRRGKKIDLHED